MKSLKKSLTKKQYLKGVEICRNSDDGEDWEIAVPTIRHGKPNLLHISREWRIAGIPGKDQILVMPDGSWKYLDAI
jgi:hypothetical protein